MALLWKHAGGETVLVPIFIAALFFLATGAVLYAGLRVLSGQVAAALGLIALAGTPFFVRHSAAQYADVPVGFFFLTTVILLAVYDCDPGKRRGWLVLSGMAVSLAVWTKNEGLLFLVALATARLLPAAVGREWRQLGRDMLALALGAAPALLALVVFKIAFAPPDGLLALQGWGAIVEKLGDWSRYQEVAAAFVKEVSSFGGGMSVVIILTFALAGADWRRFKQRYWLSGMMVLLVMVIGFFFVYIITPQRLTWYMGVSLNRILPQLWPMTVFLVLVNLRPTGIGGPPASGGPPACGWD
ncbi:MAG: glycosyltransferase family 39 protein [Candidatus Zixiibacteriota bacterium]